MILYNFLNRTSDFRISTREFWSEKQYPRNGTLKAYTDGSKMSDSVGSGVLIKGPDNKLSYRLHDFH